MTQSLMPRVIDALSAVANLVRIEVGSVTYRQWLLQQCIDEQMMPVQAQLPHPGPTLDLPCEKYAAATAPKPAKPSLRLVPGSDRSNQGDRGQGVPRIVPAGSFDDGDPPAAA